MSPVHVVPFQFKTDANPETIKAVRQCFSRLSLASA